MAAFFDFVDNFVSVFVAFVKGAQDNGINMPAYKVCAYSVFIFIVFGMRIVCFFKLIIHKFYPP